jgi:hypothetical protein
MQKATKEFTSFRRQALHSDKVGALGNNRTYGGSDVAGTRTTAVRKGINMLSMDQNIYHEWRLCGSQYIVAKTKPDIGNKG